MSKKNRYAKAHEYTQILCAKSIDNASVLRNYFIHFGIESPQELCQNNQEKRINDKQAKACYEKFVSVFGVDADIYEEILTMWVENQ